MLPIVVNFEGSFVLFHKTMFNNDYWIFDPNLDPVINILPEEFFFHAFRSYDFDSYNYS